MEVNSFILDYINIIIEFFVDFLSDGFVDEVFGLCYYGDGWGGDFGGGFLGVGYGGYGGVGGR